MALAVGALQIGFIPECLDCIEGHGESFPIPHESQQDFEAVLLDVQLLEVMLQNDGHIVGIFRLEAKRQLHAVGMGAECDIDRPLFRSERERLNDLGACRRPAAWFGERRRGRDEDHKEEKHRRTGYRHTPPLRGIQYAATCRVHHYCLWNTRSPACEHEWQLAV